MNDQSSAQPGPSASDGGQDVRQLRVPGNFCKIAALVMVAALMLAARAQAVLTQTFQLSGTTVASEDSRPISAKAVFTIDASKDKITLVLTNLTVDPARPSQLLTGISFALADPDGEITNLQLQSATTIGRIVNSDGTYTNSGSVNLLSLNTWKMGDPEASPVPLPHDPSLGIYNSTFHPDAAYGIIGNPGGNNKYDGAVMPSGQSPYSAESITFVFRSKAIDGNTSIDGVVFGFGTSFQSSLTSPNFPPPISPIPEASTFVPLLGIVGLAFGTRYLGRRRVSPVPPVA